MKNPTVKFQFGSVCYRDPIDSPHDVQQVHQLSEDINSLVAFLGTVRADDGGDGPEDWVGACNLALHQIKWRDGAKSLIHIANAPVHGRRYCGQDNHEEESGKLEPLIAAVAKRGIIVSGLDLNSGATLSFNECRKIYEFAKGPKFTVESFAVQGSYGDGAVCEASGASVSHSFCCSAACFAPARGIRTKQASLKSKSAKPASMACCSAASDMAPPMSDAIGEKLAACVDSACDDALGARYDIPL
jgi:hypothetical protein